MLRSASLFIGPSDTVAVFTIFATSNVDSMVGIPHKIYSMQRILIHIKGDLFVKCAHLHPGYARNLVARSQYYHCHWTILIMLYWHITVLFWWICEKGTSIHHNPDSKVHGTNMGPIWVLSAPDGPHVGPMNLAIRELLAHWINICFVLIFDLLCIQWLISRIQDSQKTI